MRTLAFVLVLAALAVGAFAQPQGVKKLCDDGFDLFGHLLCRVADSRAATIAFTVLFAIALMLAIVPLGIVARVIRWKAA